MKKRYALVTSTLTKLFLVSLIILCLFSGKELYAFNHLETTKIVSVINGEIYSTIFPTQDEDLAYVNFPFSKGDENTLELRIYIQGNPRELPEKLILRTNLNIEIKRLNEIIETLYTLVSEDTRKELLVELREILRAGLFETRIPSNELKIEKGELYYSFILKPTTSQFARGFIESTGGKKIMLGLSRHNTLLPEFTMKFYKRELTHGVGVYGFNINYAKPADRDEEATQIPIFNTALLNRLYLSKLQVDDAKKLLSQIIKGFLEQLSWPNEGLLAKRGLLLTNDNTRFVLNGYYNGEVRIDDLPISFHEFLLNFQRQELLSMIEKYWQKSLMNEEAFLLLKKAFGEPINEEAVPYENIYTYRVVKAPDGQPLQIPDFYETSLAVTTEQLEFGFSHVWINPGEFENDNRIPVNPLTFNLKDKDRRAHTVFWGLSVSEFPAALMLYSPRASRGSSLFGSNDALQKAFAAYRKSGLVPIIDWPDPHHIAQVEGYELSGSETLYRNLDEVLRLFGYSRKGPHPINIQNDIIIDEEGHEIPFYQLTMAKGPSIDEDLIITESYPRMSEKPGAPNEIGHGPYYSSQRGNDIFMSWGNVNTPKTEDELVKLLFCLAKLDFLRTITGGNLDQKFIVRIDALPAYSHFRETSGRPLIEGLSNVVLAVFPNSLIMGEIVGMFTEEQITRYAKWVHIVQGAPLGALNTGRYAETAAPGLYKNEGSLSNAETILFAASFMSRAGTPAPFRDVTDQKGAGATYKRDFVDKKGNPVTRGDYHDSASLFPNYISRGSIGPREVVANRMGHKIIKDQHPFQTLGSWAFYALGGDGIAMTLPGQFICNPCPQDWQVSNKEGVFFMPRDDKYIVQTLGLSPEEAEETEAIRASIREISETFHKNFILFYAYIQEKKDFTVIPIKRLSADGKLIGKLHISPASGYFFHFLNTDFPTFSFHLDFEKHPHPRTPQETPHISEEEFALLLNAANKFGDHLVELPLGIPRTDSLAASMHLKKENGFLILEFNPRTRGYIDHYETLIVMNSELLNGYYEYKKENGEKIVEASKHLEEEKRAYEEDKLKKVRNCIIF